MNAAPLSNKVKAISLRLVIVIAVFLFSFFVFAAIADEMVLEGENKMDMTVFHAINGLTSTGLTRFMLFITFFGSDKFLLPAYIFLVGYFLISKKTRRLSFDVAAIGITSTILLFSLKFLFHRQRPLDALITQVNGYSFPSGHSFSSFTFFGLLIYILWSNGARPAIRWTLSILLFVLACLIAFSRVYLHVHYASDVVAGFFLCIVWLGISFWLINKFQHRLH